MSQGEGGTPNINMNNLNQMTNLAAGGVQVPGGMPGMPQGQPNPGMSNGSSSKGVERNLLNTYIYDYFIRHDMFDSARAILQEAEVSTEPGTSVRRGSPSRRSQKHDPDGNMINGMDDPMDSDRKDDGEGSERGADLPLPKVPQDSSGGSFLYDWWSLFWDIFGARTGKSVSGPAITYVNQVQAKSREQQQRLIQITQAGGLMAGQLPGQFMAGYQGNSMMRVPNGVIHGGDDVLQQKNLARQAMVNNQRKQPFPQNSTQHQLQQMKNQQQQQMMQQQAMQRDQSVDGERPQSPAPGQNGSSPSKRPRIDGGDFQAGAGRGQLQNMPNTGQNNTQAVLMHHGINPNALTPAQFAQFQGASSAAQAKTIAAYTQGLRMHQQSAAVNAGMGNPALIKGGAMPNAQLPGVSAAHGAPMVHQTSADGGPSLNDFYNGGGMGRGGINPTGNHALQDYQMQLMLLEQQNKKRLMMARAEQDQIHMRGNEPRPDGSVPYQSLSPSGPRAAPSPQPSADIKRGTPKMGAQPGPGSPLPDGNMQIQRGSPAAAGIAAFNGQPTMPNAAMMRPPSSHPGFAGVAPHMNEQAMNPAMRQQAAQAGRGQPTMWPASVPIPNPQAAAAAQQQMAQLAAHAAHQAGAQQPQGQQPQQAQTPQVAPSPAPSAGGAQNIGTPGARPGGPHQAMPPPSAPAANQTAGRTSPQSNAMPPTPTNKAGGAARKKDAKGDRKQSRPSKKAAGAAAANVAAGAPTPSDAETPAPDTPMTPSNANSFSGPGNVGKVQGNFPNPAVPVAGGASVPEAVPNAVAAVSQSMAPTESSENPGFGVMGDLGGFGDQGELMEFDFESFLNPEATATADLNFDFTAFGGGIDDVTLDGAP
ncbi:Transcriptional activator [Drechslerella dactyloides]|uniref:Transcriptional activator n=1 Tax=Drechslerella dactyloides TaxID=74499 RepID=A0AAD6J7Z3_DREDA|nr:Transcriptional activator [Drechslerella dactyloides]